MILASLLLLLQSSVQTYLESLPFADQMPSIPQYSAPKVGELDWVIYKGRALSTSGLPKIDGDYLIGPAYRSSIAAGHSLPIEIGVIGDGGTAIFGGGYSSPGPWNSRSVFVKDSDGTFENIRCRIIGLSDDAEISTGWDDKWGYVEELGLFNIGIRGENDTFIVRGINRIGRFTMDGCWWLAEPGRSYASGLHADSWERLIIRKHVWKGINLREHNFYLKSSRGETWIIQNNLFGGNRTGFQIRPQVSDNEAPIGPVVIAGNYARRYGWNFTNADGGSCISVWSNPNAPTFIVANKITDARYGCLLVGGQAPDRNFLNVNGFPIQTLFVKDNIFENKRAKRASVMINATERTHWGANTFTRLDLNNKWGIQKHGIRNGPITFYDSSIVFQDVRNTGKKIAPKPFLTK